MKRAGLFFGLLLLISSGVYGDWSPVAISDAPTGNIYVISKDAEVRAYSPAGALLKRWSVPRRFGESVLWVEGDYDYMDLDVGPDGNIYVVTANPGWMIKFSPEGVVLSTLQIRAERLMPGGHYPTKEELRYLKIPEIGIEVNRNGIYVLDCYLREVKFYSFTGVAVITDGFLDIPPRGFVVSENGEIKCLESNYLSWVVDGADYYLKDYISEADGGPMFSLRRVGSNTRYFLPTATLYDHLAQIDIARREETVYMVNEFLPYIYVSYPGGQLIWTEWGAEQPSVVPPSKEVSTWGALRR